MAAPLQPSSDVRGFHLRDGVDVLLLLLSASDHAGGFPPSLLDPRPTSLDAKAPDQMVSKVSLLSWIFPGELQQLRAPFISLPPLQHFAARQCFFVSSFLPYDEKQSEMERHIQGSRFQVSSGASQLTERTQRNHPPP